MSGPTSTTWHTPSPRPNHIYHPASYTTSITYIQRLRNVSLEENVNFSILRSIHKSFAFYMRLQMPGSYRGLRHSWYIQPFGCQTHLLSLCLPVILLFICILYVVYLDLLYFLTHPTIWFPDPPTISFHFLAPGMMAPMGESKASMSNNNNANEKPKEGVMIVRQDDNNWTVSGSICFGVPALWSALYSVHPCLMQ